MTKKGLIDDRKIRLQKKKKKKINEKTFEWQKPTNKIKRHIHWKNICE